MALFTNSAEGGTDGVTATQGSGGNTGGASGDYFEVVARGPGSIQTLEFQDVAANTGLLGYNMTTNGTGQLGVEWDLSDAGKLGAAQPELWSRFYRRAVVRSTPHGIFRHRAPTTLNQRVRLQLTNLFNWQVVDAGGTIRYTSTPAEPADAWYRIETHWTKTTFQYKVWTADKDSTGTPDEDSGVLSFDFGSGSAEDAAWCSFGGNQFSTNDFGTDYVDDIAISTDDWIGPVSVAEVPSLWRVMSPQRW